MRPWDNSVTVRCSSEPRQSFSHINKKENRHIIRGTTRRKANMIKINCKRPVEKILNRKISYLRKRRKRAVSRRIIVEELIIVCEYLSVRHKGKSLGVGLWERKCRGRLSDCEVLQNDATTFPKMSQYNLPSAFQYPNRNFPQYLMGFRGRWQELFIG